MGQTKPAAQEKIDSEVVQLLILLLDDNGDPVKEVAELLETMPSKAVSQFRRLSHRSQDVLKRLQSSKSTAARRRQERVKAFR